MVNVLHASGGGVLPAVIHVGSRVLDVSGSSVSTSCGDSTMVTLTALADCWVRVGRTSAVAADGGDGCFLLPVGCPLPEPVPPGSWVALATVDGSSAKAVVRFSDG